jgi:hypothetical protein
MTQRQTIVRNLRATLMKLPMMLSCAEFESFVLDYFEGALSARQYAVFKMHLMVCRDCKSYLAAYERSVAMGKEVFKEPYTPVPDDMPEDLIQAILAAKAADSKPAD